MNRGLVLAAAAALPLLAGCSSAHGTTTGSGGSSSASATGGSGGSRGSGSAYTDLAALDALGVSPTCALNQGVCHASQAYPELGTAQALLAVVGAPCQLGIQDPASTVDTCEIPGDHLTIGGQDLEILQVTVDPAQPFPPVSVALALAGTPASLDPSGAVIHRPSPAGGDVFSRSLAGVTIASGTGAGQVTLGLAGATDPGLATFLDVRVWHGDRVRMGDPNSNGIAHASPMPWAEVTPGDPARSFFYQRLITDMYGPVMPLIPRTWDATATRAVWCWIRGLPANATPPTLTLHDPIDYADCPADPNAPDPNAIGGWPAVKVLFESTCATGPCHSTATHSADLDLTPDATFGARVIDVPSSQVPTALRVVPGQPMASYLLCKVDPGCTSRAMGTAVMPKSGTPLTADQIQTVSDWILNGAPTQ